MKIKNICCIGAGYVGGPTMAVIALKCPHINVTVVDMNKEKIEKWNGDLEHLPVYEPGLKEIIAQVRNKNLFFSDKIDESIKKSEMIFMAVNTPTKVEGKGAGMAADLSFVESCAKNIALVSKNDKIVIEKSTLPVRTAERIKTILKKYNNECHFEILSNPEFLAEGSAIEDLFKSDRVLIGGDKTKSGQKAVQALVNIYLNWIPLDKIITTNVWSSELSKLASNAMLAQRISSINSISAICEKTGADIIEVSKAIGMDHRIGPYFLLPSPGFGGSCFQKDILNLVYLCEHYGLNEVAEFWLQVKKINDYQRNRLGKKINDSFSKDSIDKKVTILGWAFKKNTDDSRESSSIYISYYLLEQGCNIKIYDPKVSKNRIYMDLMELNKLKKTLTEEVIKESVEVMDNIDDAINNTEVIAILTEWDEFKNINTNLKIFDLRNILNSNETFFRL
jgi:UDPglucose 6-dehydrogenase